jgi:hypothetical protein
MAAANESRTYNRERLRQALTYPVTPQSAKNIATIIKTVPIHPSSINDTIATSMATEASRNVGTNGQGLCVGAVISDSVG